MPWKECSVMDERLQFCGSRYAGSFFLTIAGSIMSAITGLAIKELPARLRSTSGSAPKAELGPQ